MKNSLEMLICLEILTLFRLGYFVNTLARRGGGGGGGHIVPCPFLLYLLFNYHQTWHDSSLRQNLSKTVKVKSILTSLWRLWGHAYLCSVEYRKLLKTVYIKISDASSSFIRSYSNLAETFNTNVTFDLKSLIWFEIIDISLVLMTSST